MYCTTSLVQSQKKIIISLTTARDFDQIFDMDQFPVEFRAFWY